MIFIQPDDIKSRLLGPASGQPKNVLLDEGNNFILFAKVTKVNHTDNTFDFHVINGNFDGTYDLTHDTFIVGYTGPIRSKLLLAGEFQVDQSPNGSALIIESYCAAMDKANSLDLFLFNIKDDVEKNRLRERSRQVIGYIKTALTGQLVKQDLVDWFDPHNIDHIRAYRHHQDNGNWPENFIPDFVIRPVHWFVELSVKMADQWVDLILDSHQKEVIEKGPEALENQNNGM